MRPIDYANGLAQPNPDLNQQHPSSSFVLQPFCLVSSTLCLMPQLIKRGIVRREIRGISRKILEPATISVALESGSSA